MGHEISRRDFLNGAALTVAASPHPVRAARRPRRCGAGLYPPALAGLRGSTDDAYAVIHGVAREGRRYDIDKLEAEETYDLVVVGAGLAGLTAAWAYRERRPQGAHPDPRQPRRFRRPRAPLRVPRRQSAAARATAARSRWWRPRSSTRASSGASCAPCASIPSASSARACSTASSIPGSGSPSRCSSTARPSARTGSSPAIR